MPVLRRWSRSGSHPPITDPHTSLSSAGVVVECAQLVARATLVHRGEMGVGRDDKAAWAPPPSISSASAPVLGGRIPASKEARFPQRVATPRVSPHCRR
jgi:hypothetical protein